MGAGRITDLYTTLVLVEAFKGWLDITGRGYLHSDLGEWDPGSALLEIYRRAGVRGIKLTDSVPDTIGMARDIIALSCKPRW